MKWNADRMLAAVLTWAAPTIVTADLEVGIELVAGDAVRLELKGAAPGEIWTLQDTYDGQNWRDLAEFGATSFLQETINREAVPHRLFRAVRKAMATPQEALEQARQRWEDAKAASYVYLYETESAAGAQRFLVSVQAGSFTEIMVLQFQQSSHPRLGEWTIEDLFQEIKDAIDLGPSIVEVRYHPTLGYPEMLRVEFADPAVADDWRFAVLHAPQVPEPSLESSVALWNSRGPRSYQFHLDYETAWWRWNGLVRVTDGKAEVLENGSQPGAPLDHIIQPMENYFALIQGASESDDDIYTSFHPTLGYPVFISINWSSTLVDGPGEHYLISDFAVLDSPD